MKHTWRILIPVVFLASTRASVKWQNTPPMGWNSWDSFGRTITESEVRHTAEKVSNELKRFGWKYIVIDEGWYISNPQEQDASKFRS